MTLSLHFAASDTHHTVYVVAGDKRRALAWIRRQAQPARYQYVDVHKVASLRKLSTEVVALMGTLPSLQRTALRHIALTESVVLREVWG